MAAEGAHQKKLEDMRKAAKAKKKQPPPPLRVPRGPSRRQKQRLSRPSRRSQIDIEGLVLSDVDENASADEDEIFDGEAILTQRDIIKLMSDSMAKAMEKVDKRSRRSIPINSADPHLSLIHI